MASSFTVVICHGSYHTPAPYKPFMAALHDAGIDSFCPQLPTSDLSLMNVGDVANPDYTRDEPPQGYPKGEDDVQVMSRLLHRLVVEESRNVVLLGHSSGGWVASEVAVPALQAPVRHGNGKRGGVIGIYYATGFAIPVGENLHSFFQPKDGSPPVVPPYCKFYKPNFGGVASAVDGEHWFFNALPDAEAKRWAASLTASPALSATLTNDVYSALPLAYLTTESGDQAMPTAYQDGLVAFLKQRPGVRLREYRCKSDHSPHLSWKMGLVDSVREFGEDCLAGSVKTA